MTVAVVVPCRNEAATICRLLEAVASQTRPPDDLVIVDDRSTDRTVALVEDWCRAHAGPPVRVVTATGRGAGAAMNTGIAECTAEVIVRLDGHSVPAPDYIERSLEALCHVGVGVAGGAWVIEPGAETLVARAIARVVSHPLGSGGAPYRRASTNKASGGPERVATVPFGAFRRELWHRLGGFDETLAANEDFDFNYRVRLADHDSPTAAVGSGPVETVPFGTFRRDLWRHLGGYDERLTANQDFDFNYRARRAGLEVVLDRRIWSIYRARPTLAALGRQYHRYGFWKVQMLRKDPRALRWRQIPPALLLPWLLATGVLAYVFPNPVALAAAALYPAITVAGAADIALRAKAMTFWPAACAALVTMHLAWSAGFWRALLRLSAPQSSGR